jgi:hypothetical protein
MPKVYSIKKPQSTHTRSARCQEVDCEAQANGWIVAVDESTDLGQRQAHYIRDMSGRAHTESREGPSTVFQFPPGEQCFADHRLPLDRPELYIVDRFRHSGPDPWLNDFGDHLDHLERLRG